MERNSNALDRQTILRRRGDLKRARGLGVRLQVQDFFPLPLLQFPGARSLYGPVGGPRAALEERSVSPKFQRTSPARRGEGIGSRPVDGLGRGVFFVGMDPLLLEDLC